jgi:hypothetical protein
VESFEQSKLRRNLQDASASSSLLLLGTSAQAARAGPSSAASRMPMRVPLLPHPSGAGVPRMDASLLDAWLIARRTARRAANIVGMVTSAIRAMLNMNDPGMAAALTSADGILAANLADQANNNKAQFVRESFDYFFAKMGLQETYGGGQLNVDELTGNAIAMKAAVTLSRAYLDELRTKSDVFKAMHGGTFISIKAFVDLARCPVIFSVGPDAAALLISSVLFVEDDRTKNTAFDTWLRASQQGMVTQALGGIVLFEQQYSISPVLIFDRYEMIRTALMRFRCGFTLSNERSAANPVKERAAIAQFFDMDLNSWVKTLYESTSPFAKEKYKTLEEWTDAVVEHILPPKSVRDIMVQNMRLAVVKSGPQVETQAQQLDLFYANLVHGASVRTPLQEIWCPHNEMEHSLRDSEEFFRVMWKGLQEVLEDSIERLPDGSSAADVTNAFIESIRNVKEAKKIMKEMWEKTKSYRVSDKVHMMEIQILQRMKQDGCFPWINDPSICSTAGRMGAQGSNGAAAASAFPFGGGADDADGEEYENGGVTMMTPLHMCFFLRRHTLFCSTFAAAVGKRLYTERLSGLQKGTILDHNRSVKWSETEYCSLVQLVQDNRGILVQDMVDGFRSYANGQNVLFADYSGMLPGGRQQPPQFSIEQRIRWDL